MHDWSDETRRTFRREIPRGLAAPDHTVPYGTVLLRTLSQALRARDALADILQQRLARVCSEIPKVPEGRRDRSLARSAWDTATQKIRPVGYGMIRARMSDDSMIRVTKIFNEKYLWD